MSDKAVLDYERRKVAPRSRLGTRHYLAAAMAGVTGFACSCSVLCLLDVCLTGPNYGPPLIGPPLLFTGSAVVGIITFKRVLETLPAESPSGLMNQTAPAVLRSVTALVLYRGPDGRTFAAAAVNRGQVSKDRP